MIIHNQIIILYNSNISLILFYFLFSVFLRIVNILDIYIDYLF
jgi:hypothetical protein